MLFHVDILQFVKFKALSPAGCSVSRPGMEAFGQPAGANLRMTSSPMIVQSLSPVTLLTGQQYTAGPVAPHPPPQPQNVLVPYTDARYVKAMSLDGN